MRVRVRARWYVLCWQLSRSALVRLKWCWWSVLRANAGHADLIGWAADREVAVRSQAGLPEGVAGVIVANELLDNLPARVVQRHGGQVQELWVAPGGVAPAFERPGIPAAGSELELTWRPMVGDDAAALAACEWWDNVPDDAPVPWSAGAAEWVAEAQRRLALGILVVVDYGARTSAEVAGRDGWLRTYAQGAVGTDPLENLGGRDLTTDVPFDQLPQPDRLVTQADALVCWGIDQLVAAASAPGSAARRCLGPGSGPRHLAAQRGPDAG